MDSPRIALAMLDCAHPHGAGRPRAARGADWLKPMLAWLWRITSARTRS